MQFPDRAEAYGAAGTRLADSELVAWLRAFADLWIDSARNTDGSEEPGKRNLNRALPRSHESLQKLLQDWVNLHSLPVLLSEHGELGARDLQAPNPSGMEPRV